MAHQCIHCGKLYENAAPELLTGCSCGSKFFFYIKQEQYEKLKNPPLIDLSIEEKKRIESDVREMIDVEEEEPVILDLENVKVIKPGKFQIDIVSLFSKKKPVIYKLEEGKYIIDLASTLRVNQEELNKMIVNPGDKKKK